MPLAFNEDKQNKRIEELQAQEAEALAQTLSGRYGLPYIDLSKTAINTDALKLIPEAEARAKKIAIFKAVGTDLSIAIISPNNEETQAVLRELKDRNFNITTFLCSENSLARAWERYADLAKSSRTTAGVIDISVEAIANYADKFKTVGDVTTTLAAESRSAAEQGADVSSILELVLAGGITIKASDIHIEPQEESIRLRYRLDGVLHDIDAIDPKVYKQILSRIKLVSGMKLNVKQSAQDGRFSIKLDKVEIEIRTSVLPSGYGESVVMRILNPESIAGTFDNLGVEPHLFEIMKREISRPNGMVLLTGPTGSGKTTTLYSFLRQVNDPGSKIITIEDPIEYHLKGVNQTQVNAEKDYTFANGLRAAVRQDPDIIMVGEIRDPETADIATNAALTGHLVFSTLHTNNAAGAIPRLINLGVNPKILTSALTLPIAQRLVRRLCENCRKETAPETKDKKLIDEVVASIKQKRSDIAIPQTEKVWTASGILADGNACVACNGTGYKGRQGVFEAIFMDEAVAKVAIENPSEREIKIAARPQGILDMRQDGILKVLSGITSLDELGRIVDLTEEVI